MLKHGIRRNNSRLRASKLHLSFPTVKASFKYFALALFLAVFVSLVLSPQISAGDGDGQSDNLPPIQEPVKKHPKLDSALAEKVEKAQSQKPSDPSRFLPQTVEPPVEKIRVIVEVEPGKKEVAVDAVQAVGGQVETTYENLVQAMVPAPALTELADNNGIRFISKPLKPIPAAITSQGVSIINAVTWQSTGIKGKGVKIAALDVGFKGYASMLGTELPSSVVAKSFRADQDIQANEKHGTAVTEIIYDIAPEAQLYLVNADTIVELGNAVDWLIGENVNIISHSVGWSLGIGDGTGPVNNIVTKANNAGILWINAAGNEAQHHWSGNWADANNNKWLEFQGSVETQGVAVAAGQEIEAYITWDDVWGSSSNDYDLYLYNSAMTMVDYSTNVQNGFGYPLEYVEYTAPSSGTYYLSIRKYSSSKVSKFNLFSNYHNLQYPVAAGSLGIPADSPYAISVGAVPWNAPGTLATYSSQGPTMDNRVKPDIVAPTGVSTVSYGINAFPGTSSSAPHVSAAAALVKQANPSWTPAQIKAFLESRAVELGAPGKDNQFGSGRLNLGAVPDLWISSVSINTPAYDNTPDFSWAPASGVSYYEVRMDAGPWINTGNVVTYSWATPLSAGSHVFEVRASNSTGNKGATAGVTFSLAAELPHLFLGSASIDSVNVVAGTKVSAIVDGAEVAQTTYNGTQYSLTVAAPLGQSYKDKTVSFKIDSSVALQTAKHVPGQVTNFNLVVDATPPTAPANLSKTTSDNNNKPAFAWTASTDALSGVDHYELQLDTGNWIAIGNVTAYTLPSSISDGNHTVNLKAVDKSGNNSSPGSLPFTIDTTPPTAPTNLAKTTPNSNNKPAFTWTASTDATIGVDYYQAQMDSGAWAKIGNVVTYTWLTALSDGSHTLNMRALDKAGNIGQPASLNFTIDANGPSAPSNLAKTTPDNNNKPAFTWTASTDAISGIDYYEMRLDGGTWTNAGNATTYTWPYGLANGDHNIEIRAIDKAANTGNTANLAFSINFNLLEAASGDVLISVYNPDGWSTTNYLATPTLISTMIVNVGESVKVWSPRGYSVSANKYPPVSTAINNGTGIANIGGNPLPALIPTHTIQTLTVTTAGTFHITLPAGATGTATSGTATVTGSPQTLVDGNNVTTATSIGTFTLSVILVSTDVSGIRTFRTNTIYPATALTDTVAAGIGQGDFTPGAAVSATINNTAISFYGWQTVGTTLPPGITDNGKGRFYFQFIVPPLPVNSSASPYVLKINVGSAERTANLIIHPRVRASPFNGRKGTTITFSGGGFHANSPIDVEVRDAITPFTGGTASMVVSHGTTTSDADGSFIGTFAVPEIMVKAKNINVKDSAGATANAIDAKTEQKRDFVVDPTVVITPNSGVPGGTVTLNGSEFPANSTITTFTIGGVSALASLSNTMINADGKITGASFIVPPGLTSGVKPVFVTATGQTSSTFTTFTVTQAPIAVISMPQNGNSYFVTDNISFNGSQSSDPDGDTLTYEWISSKDGILATTATLTTKLTAGSHTISLKVSDGKGGQNTASITITVKQQKALYASWGNHETPTSIKPGQMVGVPLTVINTGTQTWPKGGANPVYVTYHWYSASWQPVEWGTGLRSSFSGDVASGQSVGLTASLKAPSTPGTYNLIWDVVQEGVAWFSGQGAPLLAVNNITVAASQAKDVQWVSHTTPATIKPGQMVGAPITLINTGSQTWLKGGANPVYVTYHWYNASWQTVEWGIGLRSSFAQDVPSGQMVSLTASLKAPTAAGSYNLVWDIVQEGMAWFSGQGAPILGVSGITVASSQQRDVQWVSQNTPTSLKPGEMAGVPITLTNTGSQTWSKDGANPVYVTYHWYNASWQPVEWGIGLRSSFVQDVPPGQMVSLTASLKAPSNAGNYNLIWDVVHEGVAWFSGQGAPILGVSGIAVASSQQRDVQWVSQSTPTTIKPGEMVGVPITLTNTGSQTWLKGGANPVYVTYHWYNTSWQPVEWGIGLRSSFAQDVPSGQMVSLTSSLKAPSAAGSYNLIWDVVHEGIAWFSGQGAPILGVSGVTIAATQAKDVQWVSQNTPASLQANQQVNVTITLINTGSQVWSKSGANAIHISYHWYNASWQLVQWDGQWSMLPADVASGQMVTLSVSLKAPSGSGTYNLMWDIVQDGVGWFSGTGAPVLPVAGIVVQ